MPIHVSLYKFLSVTPILSNRQTSYTKVEVQLFSHSFIHLC